MEIVGGTTQEEIIGRRKFLKRLIGLSGSGEDTSLLDTAKLASTATLITSATTPVAGRLQDTTGVGIGNRGDFEKYEFTRKENMVSRFLMYSGIAPIIEEGLFRFLPSILFPKRLGTLWKVGIPTSAGFAASHNYNEDEETKQWKLYTDTIPIYQFGFGILFWKLMRERGYLHALVGHSVVNTISGLFDYLPFSAKTHPNIPKNQPNVIQPEVSPPY